MNLSVIIPACNEIFLQKTIDSLLQNAHDSIEVIVFLDGYWPKPMLKDDKRVIILHETQRRGRRFGTNMAASVAKGKYLMKTDAHCAFADGFDTVLTSEMDKDWIVTPRRYSLDVDKWGIEDNGKVRDAHYLSYPTAFLNTMGFGMHIKDWNERGREKSKYLINEEMVSQGSCWIMHRDYFQPLDESLYGIWEQDWQEMGLRVWMSGGTCVINKKTWYAHLWKGKRFGRMYDLSKKDCRQSIYNSTDYWFNNRMPGAARKFEWLIDRFWPVPTWPENWKDLKLDFPEAKPVVPVTKNIPVVAITEEAPKVMNPTTEYIMKKFNLSGHGRIGIMNYSRNEMAKLFCELGFKIGAEIGTFTGLYAAVLCDANPGLKLICIDAWETYNEYGDWTSTTMMNDNLKEAHDRLDPRGCEFIRKYSLDAAKDIPDESLDFVYIDANHAYEYVVADIVAWSKKVRKGGIISGHDYKVFHKYNPFCHVKEAVDGYTTAYRIDPWFVFQTRVVDKGLRHNRAGSFMWVKE